MSQSTYCSIKKLKPVGPPVGSCLVCPSQECLKLSLRFIQWRDNCATGLQRHIPFTLTNSALAVLLSQSQLAGLFNFELFCLEIGMRGYLSQTRVLSLVFTVIAKKFEIKNLFVCNQVYILEIGLKSYLTIL